MFGKNQNQNPKQDELLNEGAPPEGEKQNGLLNKGNIPGNSANDPPSNESDLEETPEQNDLFDKKEFVYKFTEDCLFRGVYRYKGDEVTFPAETEVPHANRVK